MTRKEIATTPKVVSVPIEALMPYDRNPRTHSEAQVEAIANSIQQFGFNNPILIDDNKGIIAGHGRLLAAHKLGLKEVPVLMLSHLSDTQKRAYVISDNQVALQAGWDFQILHDEIADLKAADFDIGLLGFSVDELQRIETGWMSEVDVVAQHGENLDGIRARIVVECQQEQREVVEQVIRDALKAAGISDVKLT